MLVACAEAFGTTLHASHQNLRQNMACANRGLQSANPGNCQFPANHSIRFKSSAALCDANSTEVLSGYPADEKMKRLRLCVHCSTVLFLCFLEKLVPKKNCLQTTKQASVPDAAMVATDKRGIFDNIDFDCRKAERIRQVGNWFG